MPASIYPCMHAYMYPSIHPSIYPCIYVFIHPLICLSIHASIHLAIYSPIHSSIQSSTLHPSIHSPIHPSVHTLIHSSIHPPSMQPSIQSTLLSSCFLSRWYEAPRDQRRKRCTYCLQWFYISAAENKNLHKGPVWSHKLGCARWVMLCLYNSSWFLFSVFSSLWWWNIIPVLISRRRNYYQGLGEGASSLKVFCSQLLGGTHYQLGPTWVTSDVSPSLYLLLLPASSREHRHPQSVSLPHESIHGAVNRPIFLRFQQRNTKSRCLQAFIFILFMFVLLCVLSCLLPEAVIC